MKLNSAVKCSVSAVLFLVVAFADGCATAPPVDWNSRIGHYTYAQAVNELGPPNRQSRLSNGTREFKWFSPPAGVSSFGTGMNNNGLNNGFGAGPNPPPGFSNRYLQLTFDRNGVLTGWSKNY